MNEEFQESVLIDGQMVPVDNDYLLAYKERLIQQDMGRARAEVPEYYQVDDSAPEYDSETDDSHLRSVRARNGKPFVDPDYLEILRCDRDDPRLVAWREKRDAAKREVGLLKNAGMPVPKELQLLAEMKDRFNELEQARLSMRTRSENAWNRVR